MPDTTTHGRVLLAYFSRAGENYYYGGRRDLEVGNTETLARMIAELTEVDVHRIEAVDPYPDDYDATVARNVTEQNDNARPSIANPLDSIDRYATVLLASPIWNVRAPMIMSTFTDAYDFAGKTVLPSSPTPLAASAAWHATTPPRVPPPESATVSPSAAKKSLGNAERSPPGSKTPGSPPANPPTGITTAHGTARCAAHKKESAWTSAPSGPWRSP